MIVVGLALFVAADLFAAIGVAGYVAAKRSASKSRYAALTLFGHGAVSSSALIGALAFVHVHGTSPLTIHLHEASTALTDLLDCDFEASCAALTILLLTALILSASFAISQVSARLLLRSYGCVEDRGRARAITRRRPMAPGTRLFVVRDDAADAFSFGVLRAGGGHFLRGEDVIVLTTGLLDLLTDDEADAVLAHEAAHVAARDDRYVPFFRTLSMILFFDPVLRHLRRQVGRHHEFAADAEAARETRRPLSLARALLKVYLKGMPAPRATGLFGRASRAELVERIEALLALSAAGLGPEESM